jgi:hypothetical protein
LLCGLVNCHRYGSPIYSPSHIVWYSVCVQYCLCWDFTTMLCAVFTWRSSTFFTKLSVTFLPWHSTYFVGYCKWIVFVQRKTFHTQPIKLIFMKYSITELPYQLAEQIRWQKACCLTCVTKLIFLYTGTKD